MLSIILLVSSLSTGVQPVRAAAPEAIDVLGQTDADITGSIEPYFTKGTANDAPSRVGFSGTQHAVVDEAGHRLFVSDTGNNRVLVYNLNTDNTIPDRIPDNILGQANFNTNVSATTQSGLYAPYGLAYDSVGSRLFVADEGGNRVMVFDVAAITDGEDAVNVLGQLDFTSNGAATTQSGFTLPRALAYDSAGSRLFVVDNGNNRLMVFDVTAIADGENAVNVLGQLDFTSNAAATTQSGLTDPLDLAYDSDGGRLFVDDATNHRVLVFDVTAIADGENAVNVLGQLDFTSNAAATTQSGFDYPDGLAYDSTGERLFVAEFSNSRVLVFDVAAITDGEDAVNVLGQLDFTSNGTATTQSGLANPGRLDYDSTGNRLLVVDYGNNRVLVFDVAAITDGEDALDELGQCDADNLDALSCEPIFTKGGANDSPNRLGVGSPKGSVMDSVNHRLFATDADNNRVLVYDLDSNNELLDQVPDNVLGQASFNTNAAATTPSGLSSPNGLAYDAAGNRLFVSELSNNRVLVFDVAVIGDGEAAVNVLGQADFTTAAATTTQSGLSNPHELIYDDGNQWLYVADSGNNRILVFDVAAITDGEGAVDVLGQTDADVAGSIEPIFTKGDAHNFLNRVGLNEPNLAVVDEVGHRLFVGDAQNARILVYNLNIDNTMPDRIPDNVLGQTSFNFATNSAPESFFVATGLAYDSAGQRLFVSDRLSNRVMVFDVAAITNGEDAVNVLGQLDFTSSAAATTQAGLNTPGGLGYDSSNAYLYVADSGNNRVMVFDVTAIIDGEDAVNVLGQPDFTTADVATTQSGMYAPEGLAHDDANDRLFVADGGNSRVLVFDVAAITDGETAANVLGQLDFTTADVATTQSGMSNPHDLAYDSVGQRLFVSDTASSIPGSPNNSRVLVFDVAAITDGEGAVNVLGQPDFTTADGTTTQSGLNTPGGLGYDSSNAFLYIADLGNNRVVVFDVAVITNGEAAANVLGQTDDNNFDPLAFEPIFTEGGRNDSRDRNWPNRLGLSNPESLTLDTSNHRLFVSDHSNNRILVFNLDSNNVLLDRIPDKVLGQADFNTKAATTTRSGLNSAGVCGCSLSLAFDSDGNILFVSDTGNNRVMVFNTASITNGEDAVNVIGQPDFTSGGQATAQNGLFDPGSLTYDSANNRLYIADIGNNRVMIFHADFGPAGGGGPAPDTTPPVLSDIAASDITLSEATISWNTNEAATTLIRWGLAFGYGSTYNDVGAYVTFHSHTLTDLAEDTTYHYQVCSTDSPSNQACSDDQMFSTLTPPDTTPPVITNVVVADITTTSVAVSWNTDEASTSLLRYGLTSAYGSTSTDSALVTSHALPLVDLTESTTYHYQVCSTDASANEACSPDTTFTTATAPPEPMPPVISGVNVTDITKTSATISWTTDIPASSEVAYGTTAAYGATKSDAALATQHAVTLVGLTPSTTYHFQVTSVGADSLSASSEDALFTTMAAEAPPTPPPATTPPPTPPPLTETPPATTPPPTETPPTPPSETPAEEPAPTAEEQQQAQAENPAALSSICGNGICESVETASSCQLDCAAPASQGFVAVPATSGTPTAGLINPDDVQFFAGTAGVPLSLIDSNVLPIIPMVRLKVYLPDIAIKKPIANAVMTVGDTTYQMFPTGSFTGHFTTPSTLGDHSMIMTVAYADGSTDTVPFTLSVRPPGVVYETIDGVPTPIEGSRITLISAEGDIIAVWDAEAAQQRNPTFSGSFGDFAFVVPSGTYKLQIDKPGYATRETLAFPATNIVAESVEMVRLPPPVLSITDVPAYLEFLGNIARVNTQEAIDNPFVEQRAREDAPIAVAVAVANTMAVGAASATAFPYLLHLWSFMAHPVLLLNRRKRKQWGVVYDALTKLPVDLAIVRLHDPSTNRIIRSSVTDREGRYFFIVPPGTYRLAVLKVGYTHPSTYVQNRDRDGKFVDLALSTTVTAGPDGIISANIPVDPAVNEKSMARVLAEGIGHRTQHAIAILSIIGALIPVIIVPSMTTMIFLAVNVLLYLLFRRLSARRRKPKNWGSVRDRVTGHPLQNAIARIFDLKYNKLLETQVTDLSGRYAFLVGANSYTVTFEKQGYAKQQRSPLDLTHTARDRGEFIAFDVRMEHAASATPTLAAPHAAKPLIVGPTAAGHQDDHQELIGRVMGDEDV